MSGSPGKLTIRDHLLERARRFVVFVEHSAGSRSRRNARVSLNNSLLCRRLGDTSKTSPGSYRALCSATAAVVVLLPAWRQQFNISHREDDRSACACQGSGCAQPVLGEGDRVQCVRQVQPQIDRADQAAASSTTSAVPSIIGRGIDQGDRCRGVLASAAETPATARAASGKGYRRAFSRSVRNLDIVLADDDVLNGRTSRRVSTRRSSAQTTTALHGAAQPAPPRPDRHQHRPRVRN